MRARLFATLLALTALSACPTEQTDPLVFTPATLPDAYAGADYQHSLSAAGGQAPYWFRVASGELPPGISLSRGGDLEGTPVTPGEHAFSVTAADASGREATATLSMTVLPPVAVTFESPPDLYVGELSSAQGMATGGKPPYTWSISSGTLPAGMALTSEGVLAGSPNGGGAFPLQVQAADANGRTASVGIQLLVYELPQITTTALPAGEVGQQYQQLIRAIGGKIPISYAISGGSLPDGLGFSAGALSGTPTAAGDFQFEVTITDANGHTDSLTLALTIYAVGEAPAIEVASWNIEWFGDGTNGPSDETRQLQNATAVIADAGFDVWGVAEIVSPTQFDALVSGITGYAGVLATEVSNAGSHYAADEQKLGFIYDAARVSVISSSLILTGNSYEFAGRPPLQILARLTAGSVQEDVTFIVVHLKAGATEADRTRRVSAASLLKTHIDNGLSTAKVMVIGDFNDDVDESIVWGGAGYLDTPFRSIVDDAADYGFVTASLSQAGKSSTASYDDMIDHHLTTNPMRSLLSGDPEVVRPDLWAQPVASYATTTSDHYPVVSRYRLSGTGGAATSVLMNEVLYDEPGTTDYGKEFVEVLNAGASAADLSGWTLSDASAVRHTFPAGTHLLPGKALVVFGDAGGLSAAGISNGVAASSGQLSFHPTDQVVLKKADGAVVDSLSWSSSYGEGVSANRATDGDPEATWVAHDSMSAASSSPGIRADGTGW